MSVTIEYAHTYLKELVDGAEPPNLGPVEAEIEKHDDVTTVVIVDDTNADCGIPRDSEFAAERDRLTEEWVSKLDIDPDVVLYESDFTETVEWMMYQVPLVRQNDLTPELDVGAFYTTVSDGLYFYTGTGTSTTRARITDYRDGAKVTNISCGAYDAAMTLAKLGVAPTPDERIVSDGAITFHDPYYIDSPPYGTSAGILRMLRENDVVEFDESQVDNRPLAPEMEASD